MISDVDPNAINCVSLGDLETTAKLSGFASLSISGKGGGLTDGALTSKPVVVWPFAKIMSVVMATVHPTFLKPMLIPPNQLSTTQQCAAYGLYWCSVGRDVQSQSRLRVDLRSTFMHCSKEGANEINAAGL